jgi:hypothetical protein
VASPGERNDRVPEQHANASTPDPSSAVNEGWRSPRKVTPTIPALVDGDSRHVSPFISVGQQRWPRSDAGPPALSRKRLSWLVWSERRFFTRLYDRSAASVVTMGLVCDTSDRCSCVGLRLPVPSGTRGKP